MKLFQCQSCAQLVYFENIICEKCGHQLGFLPEIANMTSIEPTGSGIFQVIAAPGGRYRYCTNASFGVCNWLVAAKSPDALCMACRHNRIIPDVSIPANLRAWQQTEFAKHRLFYSLIMLRLPLENRQDAPEYGLTFEFPASQGLESKIATGHDNGVITIALEEADDVERETRRTAMHEPYRTLLGHFRHEIGHYYWDRLVRDGNKLDAARAVFGDDRVGYSEALKAHYANGAPPDWQHNFVTPYATAHPWEDFAETWAHYLHIVDTLEMAGAFGLQIRPPLDTIGDMRAVVDFDPYNARHMNHIVEIWLPLSIALNSLNRAMGQADVYPFVLSEGVIRKLGFIHNLIMANRSSSREIQFTPK
jgi:hypothetical protein